jgi:RHS repeat-associated protein
MLRDDDVKDIVVATPYDEEGVGNSYDFGARMYDPRVGRFFSLDPMKATFPWQSPYVFADNSPVLKIDIDGKKGFIKKIDGADDSHINKVVNEINLEMPGLDLFVDGDQLKIPTGNLFEPKTDLEKWFIEGLNDEEAHFQLQLTDKNSFNDDKGKKQMIIGGSYLGAIEEPSSKVAMGINIVNINHFEKRVEAGGVSVGLDIIHEASEAYLGARLYGIHGYDKTKYETAHEGIMNRDSRQKDGVSNFLKKSTTGDTLYDFFYEGSKGTILIYTEPE